MTPSILATATPAERVRGGAGTGPVALSSPSVRRGVREPGLDVCA